MEPSLRPSKPHRWITWILVVVVVAVVAMLALMLLPLRTEARQLSVTPGASAVTVFSLPGPSWVTVHFDRHGTAGMRYWMDGPSGMMFNRSMMAGGMMGGSDSYSFWTWGGDFRCGAAFSGPGFGMMPVWVNMTSAIW